MLFTEPILVHGCNQLLAVKTGEQIQNLNLQLASENLRDVKRCCGDGINVRLHVTRVVRGVSSNLLLLLES